MRFRSCGLSASNIEEYLKKIKEKEQSYLEESTLSHITCISLVEKSNNDEDDDEYDLLKPTSNYEMKKYERFTKRRRRLVGSKQYFRKKIFFHHKRSRINSESINVIDSKIKILEWIINNRRINWIAL